MCIKSSRRVLCVFLVVGILVVATAVPLVMYADKNDVKTVVIDPGHGGMDAGVSSANGVKESDIVLLIAKALGEYLKSGGFEVVYTRKNKSALVGGKFIKKTDMKRRVEIIKRAKPDLVVSLHLNSFSDKNRRGIQVFFGDENSRNVALVMQGVLNENFNQPQVGRDFSALKADKYILNESPCTAVIIECGFLSNHIDEANLLDDTYRHSLAGSIYESILLWAFGEGA